MGSSSKDVEINRLLERATSRVRWLDFGWGFAVVGALFFLYLLAAAVADHAFGLQRPARLLLAACFYLGFPLMCALMVFRPLFKTVSPHYAARLIEEQYPEYKNTLTSYVELAAKKRPGWLRRSIARRFKTARRPPNLDQAIRYRDFMLTAYAMAAMLVIFSVYCILSDKSVSRALARVLMPWREISRPTLTVVKSVAPGDAKVPKGSTLEVTARIGGVFPQAIFLEWIGADGLGAADKMERVGDDPRRWRAALRDISDRLTYHVRAGDGQSRDFVVQTFPVLTLDGVTVRCEFPTYTRLEPVLLREKEVSAVVGSRLSVECRFNNPLKEAQGLLGSARVPVKMEESKVTFEGEVRETADYFLNCIDENDQQIVPKVLHVDAKKDLKPVVRIKNLPPVLEVPEWPEAVGFEFEVSDDFGVARSLLEYRLDGLRGEPRIIPHPPFARTFSGRYLLDLSGMTVRANSVLRFRLAAYDARVPEANRGETEWFTVKRVSGAKPKDLSADKRVPGGKSAQADAVNDLEAERRHRKARRDLERFAKAEEERIEQLARALEKLRREMEAQRAREKDAREPRDPKAPGKTGPTEAKPRPKSADGEQKKSSAQKDQSADQKKTSRDGRLEDRKRSLSQADKSKGQKSQTSPDVLDGGKEPKGDRVPKGGRLRVKPSSQDNQVTGTKSMSEGGGEKALPSDKPPGKGKGTPAECTPGPGTSGHSQEDGAPLTGPRKKAGRKLGGGIIPKKDIRPREKKTPGERRPGEGEVKGAKACSKKKSGSCSKKGTSAGEGGKGSGSAQRGAGSKGSGSGKASDSSQSSPADAAGSRDAGRAPGEGQTRSPSQGEARSTGRTAKGSRTSGGGPAGSRDEAEGENLAPDGAPATGEDEPLADDPWQGLPSTEKAKAHGKLVRRLREALSDPKKSKELADEIGWTPGQLRQFVEKFSQPLKQLEKARKKMSRRLNEVDSREGEKAKALKGGGFDTAADRAPRRDFRKTPKDKVKRLAGDEGEVFSPEYREAVTEYFKRLAEDNSRKKK